MSNWVVKTAASQPWSW